MKCQKSVLPFDPIEISKEIESLVVDGNRRRYNLFRLEPFYGGIATARAAGCNLSCAFCWINSSRDSPNLDIKLYSPEEVYQNLAQISEDGKLTKIARISGAEPTIGEEHLLSLIESTKRGVFNTFLLETNGILLGNNKGYTRELKQFREHLIVRLSLKAGTREAFEKKTGARAEFFELPFQAIRYLEEYGIPVSVCSMSKDPKIMPQDERRELLLRLSRYDLRLLGSLEEEQTDPFGVTIRRLTERGIITSAEELRQEQYVPLDLQRLLEILADLRRNDPEWKNKGLSDLIKVTLFQTIPSNCKKCTFQNPWHGHGIEDDLDSRLG